MGIMANYRRDKRQEEKDREDQIQESIDCQSYNNSNCCDAEIYDETDVCSSCKEHCGTMCEDCELYYICQNEDRVK